MKSFISSFRNPTNRYGVSPFWFLNGDLTEEELRWQVKEMKEKGLGGYVMHSRYGRRVDYFSEEFFDRIGAVIDESEKQGMNAIVYDEDDWPSGMSGTKVLDLHPEFKHKQMEIVYLDVAGKNGVDYVPDKGCIVKAYACSLSQKGERIEDCVVAESAELENDGKELHADFGGKAYDKVIVFLFQTVSGYTIYTQFPRKKGFQAQPDTWNWYFPFGEYVDLLNPDAVDCFLETTGEEYKRRFGEHFGKAIKWFFTDEPGFYTVMRGTDTAIAWSDIFAETFKERHGYDITEKLLGLAIEAGGDTRRVRYDYYEHLTYLFEHNYVRKYAQWCASNGISLMGHYRLCYPQLVWQRNYAGNVMSMFRQMQAPGVDRLDTPGMGEKFAVKDWSWQVEDKLCSSAAHQYQIERRMTESFACSGWEYRPADMKRVSDWQYMMGMNLMVPHAFHYSLSGQRKKECIPSFFYQSAAWQNFKKYGDYMCRLGEMMIGGKNIADIVILYPMTTLWADDIPEAEVQDLINNIDRDFHHITDLLLRRHLDYDIIAEDEVEKAEINGAALEIGDASYKLMIVPPMITIRKETEDKIRRFVEAGGKVLFLSMPPVKDIDGNELSYIKSLFDAQVMEAGIAAYQKWTKDLPGETCDLASGIKYISAGVLRDNRPDDAIVSAVESLIDRDVNIVLPNGEKSNIYYNHFTKEGCDVVFVHNSDEETGHHIVLSVRADKPYAYICDAEDGRVLAIPQEKADGRTCFKLYLEELKAWFLVMSDEEMDTDGEYTVEELLPEVISVTPLSDTWKARALDRNALILDTWTMVQNEVLEESGPVAWDSGFGTRLKFTSEFTLKYKPEKLEAVIDRNPEMIYEGVAQPIIYKVNGHEITDFRPSDFLDHDMRIADISAYCKEGVNELTVEYDHKMFAFTGKTGINDTGMMWDCAYIVGHFGLEKNPEAPNRYDIVAPAETVRTGSWVPQGYPFYDGCLEYSQEFELDKKEGRYILDMGDVRETVVLLVNGEEAAERVWAPFRADITDLLKDGLNTVQLQVRNTPKNIFDKCDWDCGLMSTVQLKHVK